MQELVEKLREYTDDPEGDFPAMYNVTVGKKQYVLRFQYRKRKNDGTFNKKMDELPIMMKYNPFTGEPLNQSE